MIRVWAYFSYLLTATLGLSSYTYRLGPSFSRSTSNYCNSGNTASMATFVPSPWAVTKPYLPTPYPEVGIYSLSLVSDMTILTTCTIQFPSPFHLIVGTTTMPPGESIVTVDNLVLSLWQNPPAILFHTVAAAVSPDLSSIPSSKPWSKPSGSLVSSVVPQSSTSESSRPSTAPPSVPLPNISSKNIGGGAIAGIAIGGVLILVLIIGGWYFWRRKKQRAQKPTSTLTDDELARRESQGDKVVFDPHQIGPTTGAYQTQYQEMSGNGLAQELDRSHSYKHAIGGAHELKADDRPGELPFAGIEEHGSTNGLDVVDGGESEVTQVPQTNRTATQAPQVSPHVEAQRRREVEWLEAEEMRMRQRREALLQQSGGKTEQ